MILASSPKPEIHIPVFVSSSILISLNSTSKIGPFLRFGIVSIRKIISRIIDFKDDTFLKELIWREFFMQILYHFPKTASNSFKSKYDNIIWLNDKNDFEGWVRLYQSYKVLGSNEKALKALRDATKLNPKNINLKQMLLRELLPTNKKPVFSKETSKLVDDILVLDPNNVDGLFFSGFAAYNKGEKKKAITYWDLLLKQLPKDSLMSKEINKRIKLLQD